MVNAALVGSYVREPITSRLVVFEEDAARLNRSGAPLRVLKPAAWRPLSCSPRREGLLQNLQEGKSRCLGLCGCRRTAGLLASAFAVIPSAPAGAANSPTFRDCSLLVESVDPDFVQISGVAVFAAWHPHGADLAEVGGSDRLRVVQPR